ncbi:hypothetical protein AB0J72_45325 [Dactylosporangium sp. NPDC049742]|uniref:hypothetical protein n=1 Tax=Dactylosporangium sp. NPDC049742 TaxID=3154737 RepID=UPI00342FEE13
MNLLGQFLPGVREVRTPLVVGVLWSLAAWVASALLPEKVWQREAIQTAGRQIGKLPVELVISIIILLIYLLGVLLQSIGAAVRTVLSFVATLGIPLFVVFVVAQFAFKFLIACILFLVILCLAQAWLRYRRVRPESYQVALEDTVTAGLLYAHSVVLQLIHAVRFATESDRQLFDELVDSEFESYFGENSDFLSRTVNEIEQGLLYQGAISVGLTLEEVHAVSNAEDRGDFRVKSLADLWMLRRRRENSDSDVRRALLRKLETSQVARAAFVRSVLEFDELRVRLRRRLNRAERRLRENQPEQYLEYDRLKAEGEFRSGVAVPLMVLLAALAYRWHLEFDAKDSPDVLWWLIVGAFAAGTIMIYAGDAQARKARMILYDSVRTGVIELQNDERFGQHVFVFKPTPKIERRALIKSVLSGWARAIGDRISGRSSTPES